MKILYINSLYSPFIEGGAEISLKLIVEGMLSRGHQVAVLSLSPNKGLKEEQISGVMVYRAGLENIYWPYSKTKPGKLKRFIWHIKDRYNQNMVDYLKDVLKKEKPDIVSCHNLAGWSVAVWDVIHTAGIPIVQVLHDMYLLCANSNMFKNDLPCATQCFRCHILRRSHPQKSKQVRAVVGISKNILERFTGQNYFPNAEKFVIHNTRKIAPPPERRKRQPGEPLRIGYIGTLSAIKGIEWLIDQFQAIDIPATLVIAGRGKTDYEEKLKSMVHKPAISFLGFMPSAEFYRLVDVVVVPSLWQEPLGMVAIEALANNLPVIAHKSGGLQETVIDGVNGLYCYASSPESLGQSLVRLYQQPGLYDQLAAAARESVSHILNEDRIIDDYQEVMSIIQQRH